MNNQNEKPVSAILTGQEIRRYTLQMNMSSLGIEGQEKIKQAKVLVVGAGGKGTSVLQNLTTIGVGKIGISDNFPVQEADLSRQHLYGNGDLGKQKAIVARQKLMQINHFVDFQLHNVCLSEQNINTICDQYDMLIDATDNFTARYLLNDGAIRMNKPLVHGAVFGNLGYVSVFNYKDGPSLRCAYPRPEKPDNADDSIPFSCRVTTISVIGSVMANEALKVILGFDTPLNGNLLVFDMGNYTFRFIKVERNPENFRLT
jgi:molybdopterin/thiamine biosynthesis adenylyltransferase